MKVICRQCNVEISKQVVELHDLTLLTKKDGEDYIPEGFYIVDTGEEVLDEKGTIIINLKDLLNSKYHHNRRRLNGCCGYDGVDGVNRVCINNHEIGTEKSDCWMPHYIALQSDLVEFV
ncbi:hypothetical protein [Fredinandcohnia sp. 179-A 10B2 NHS]|uniref:hypothetical protein n=1 Tax=Fredinandcohnia sp. 179-A 10B2 NHS TaxID=3235176 RepID=UPI0039A39A74